MKKIKIKIIDLFECLGMNEIQEYLNTEDIFILTPDKQYERLIGFVKKEAELIKVYYKNGVTLVCSDQHIFLTSEGLKYAVDATDTLFWGEPVEIDRIVFLGNGIAYDISLPEPHLYMQPNGIVHHNTFLSLYRSLEEVLTRDNPFKEVVIVRSIVPTRDIGFLPGSLEEKQEIYELPYKEICTTLFNNKDAWDRLKEQGYARFLSTTAIRGISIDDSIIIVDECQNFTFQELTTVITRVGHRSKIIFSGDRFQNDLITKKNDQSGLELFLDVLRSMEAYEEVVFKPDDIVRSSLVKDFLMACAAKNLLPTT